ESEVQAGFRAALIREVGKQLANALRDGTELNADIDVDSRAKEIRADVRLGAKPGSELAATLEKMGTLKSPLAPLLRKDDALNMLIHFELPDKLRDAFANVIEEAARKVLAETSDEVKQKQAKRLQAALAPTFKTGMLDLGFSLRGPDVSKRYTL